MQAESPYVNKFDFFTIPVEFERTGCYNRIIVSVQLRISTIFSDEKTKRIPSQRKQLLMK